MNKKELLLLCKVFYFVSLLFSNSFENLEFVRIDNRQYTDFHKVNFSYDVKEKINPITQEVLLSLEENDNNTLYSNHILTDNEKEIFLTYFELMPKALKDAFITNVYSIYFLDGMHYGAMTELVYDENFNKYCIIYFNSETLKKSLNDWMEYRDNSIFLQISEDNKFSIDCSSDYLGILHTLIHETCHVIDYIYNVTLLQNLEKSNEFTVSWNDYTLPNKNFRNKDLMKTDFYELGNKIKVNKGKKLLRFLKTTSFSSLYGAKNIADDFAETVTYYIFYNQLQLDYKINYVEKGIIKESYTWSENRNIEKLYSLCQLITGI